MCKIARTFFSLAKNLLMYVVRQDKGRIYLGWSLECVENTAEAHKVLTWTVPPAEFLWIKP